MKINVCCGTRVLPGYVNVDVQAIGDAQPDIIADAKTIPLPDGCAEEVMAIHAFEHFYRWDCDAVIAEWRRLLHRGGLLVLELPNVLKCCKNVIDGLQRGGKDPDQLGYWGLYGDPRTCDPYMNHRWGWAPDTLRRFLMERGFIDVTESSTQFHPAGRLYRDMRLEARKA